MCDCNAIVVGSIPTQSNELFLFFRFGNKAKACEKIKLYRCNSQSIDNIIFSGISGAVTRRLTLSATVVSSI